MSLGLWAFFWPTTTTLTADTGSFTLTGYGALFQIQQRAAMGPYTETGSAATFQLTLKAAVQTYILAGLAAPLTVVLHTTTASYMVTGPPSVGTVLLLAPVFGTYRGSSGAKPAPAETPTGSAGADWNDISNSSHLSRFQYAADSNRLSIEFNNGSAYTYQGVPSHVVDGLRSTSTPGQYFHSMIRSQYKSSKG